MDLERSPRWTGNPARFRSPRGPKVSIEPGLRPLDRVERVRLLNRHVPLSRIHDELDLGARGSDRTEELLSLPR
jgi:hypothetical protein